MSTARSQQISIIINGNISGLSDVSSEHTIYKVNAQLRSGYEQAYEPQVVSIGPYHRGKTNLKEMEKYKLIYLRGLLHRMGESSADKYIEALIQLEVRARSCYAEEISLSADGFVEMMCLDGFFIIEFLRKVHCRELINAYDPIFAMGWLYHSVIRDLILVENQVPFFILVQLFNMTKPPVEEKSLIDLALWLTKIDPKYGPERNSTRCSESEVVHLLDIVHRSWRSSFAAKLTPENSNAEANYHKLFIKSTSVLQQSGIKFETAKDNKSWLDITFENGVLKIPPLKVDNVAESVFRNLIAYEECMPNPYDNWRCVKDYALFMDCLINSPRDVEKLCHHGIIENLLGDDEAVSTLFNSLTDNVTFVRSRFCYSRVFKEVNKYARKRRNIWRAHLMRNYFNNPWSIISFLAAVFLLILTTVQTIFSILAVINAIVLFPSPLISAFV